MGAIKSAMELALERTAALKADHAGADAKEARKEGMRLAASYLDAANGQGEAPDLAAFLKSMPPAKAQAAREGLLDALMAAIQFPREGSSCPALAPVSKALSTLAAKGHAEKAMRDLFGQLAQFFERYAADMDGMAEELKRQFAPKLRQKEEELRRRTGQQVRIDPMRDPEFLSYFQKSMTQVKARYQDALDRAKADLRELAGA